MVRGKFDHFPLKSLSEFGPLNPAGDVEEASGCCKEGLDWRFLWPHIFDQQKLAENNCAKHFVLRECCGLYYHFAGYHLWIWPFAEKSLGHLPNHDEWRLNEISLFAWRGTDHFSHHFKAYEPTITFLGWQISIFIFLAGRVLGFCWQMYDSISKLLELTALSGCVSTSNLKSSLFAGLCFADQPSTIAPKTNTINQLFKYKERWGWSNCQAWKLQRIWNPSRWWVSPGDRFITI